MLVGIDIGSRTIKAAAIKDDRVIDYQIAESGFEPHRQSFGMIKKYNPSRVVATGYGRHLAKSYFANDVITEIKAHSLGARYFFPDAETIIDVGGQDTKVISLDKAGNVVNFQMNDKCAAGTGRFLEIMAQSLGYTISEFGKEAMKGSSEITINSMCTVFAESEVISLKNSGKSPQDIAKAVHISVAEKLIGMLYKIGYRNKIVFSGGVARNPCITNLLQEKLGIKILIPAIPDIVGAVGAAIFAVKQNCSASDGNGLLCRFR